jgi:hypothetical protein
MSRRLRKQFIYGLLYLVILALIGLWFYARFIKVAPSCFDRIQNQNEEGVDCGGVCANICTAGAEAIELVGGQGAAGNLFYGFPDSGHVELMAKIQNPNSNLASPYFPYVFRLHKSDGSFVDINGSSFIYADDIKYIIEVGGLPPGVTSSTISRVEFFIPETNNISSAQLVKAQGFEKPQVKVRDQQISNLSSGVEVDGHIANEGTIDVPGVTVGAIFYDALGQIIGVSKTQLDAIAAGDVRAFSITHPPLSSLSPSATVIVFSASRP